MLIILGIDLARRLVRDRVHFHSHRHGDGTVHLHAHSHKGEVEPYVDHHEHEHTRNFPPRALCVGLMHGLARSAALILATLSTVALPITGLVYVALFGLGAIGGMAMLSLAISMPLRSARRFTWLHHGAQAALAAMCSASTIASVSPASTRGVSWVRDVSAASGRPWISSQPDAKALSSREALGRFELT